MMSNPPSEVVMECRCKQRYECSSEQVSLIMMETTKSSSRLGDVCIDSPDG